MSPQDFRPNERAASAAKFLEDGIVKAPAALLVEVAPGLGSCAEENTVRIDRCSGLKAPARKAREACLLYEFLKRNRYGIVMICPLKILGEV
jgi:hypothetical protein